MGKHTPSALAAQIELGRIEADIKDRRERAEYATQARAKIAGFDAVKAQRDALLAALRAVMAAHEAEEIDIHGERGTLYTLVSAAIAAAERTT